MRVLLDQNRNYYKANLHCHTVNTDACKTPEQIKDAYKERGYSVVAFTDHEFILDVRHLTNDDFIALTGCELAIKEDPLGTTKTNQFMRVTHLCLYAEDPNNIITPCYSSIYDRFSPKLEGGRAAHDGEYERVYSAEGISDMIKKAHEKGFLVAYNHPTWSLECDGSYLGYEGVDFVEIYNNAAVKLHGLSNDESVFATMLLNGKEVFCTANDDNHNYSPFDSPYSDSFGGFVMLNTDTLSYASVIEALKTGSFYASSGPEIFSLTVEDGKINLKTSPVRKISVLSRGRMGYSRICEEGKFFTEQQIEIRDGMDGFRIKIEDASGAEAWTQFYTL